MCAGVQSHARHKCLRRKSNRPKLACAPPRSRGPYSCDPEPAQFPDWSLHRGECMAIRLVCSGLATSTAPGSCSRAYPRWADLWICPPLTDSFAKGPYLHPSAVAQAPGLPAFLLESRLVTPASSPTATKTLAAHSQTAVMVFSAPGKHPGKFRERLYLHQRKAHERFFALSADLQFCILLVSTGPN